ncbi:MAG: FAD-binding oxidoreductase, partial [Alphaproteobacteria bacterium]
AIPLAQKAEGGSIKHDISVPVSRVADFIAEADAACIASMPGVRPVAFGHVGDGNMHYNLTEPKGADTEAFMAEWQRMNRVVHDIVERLGGSISAEHGIGQLKRGELRRYRSETELSLMRALKSTLDPKGIMNPGKVL